MTKFNLCGSLRELKVIGLSVYSASEANIESHLARSLSACGEPQFSSDKATCLAVLTLNAESSRMMQAYD